MLLHNDTEEDTNRLLLHEVTGKKVKLIFSKFGEAWKEGFFHFLKES